MVKLFSKNSNLCDHNSPTSQTDGQTDRRHAIAIPRFAVCTKVHRAVIKQTNASAPLIQYRLGSVKAVRNNLPEWNLVALTKLWQFHAWSYVHRKYYTLCLKNAPTLKRYSGYTSKLMIFGSNIQKTLECACFSFHVVLLFYQLFTARCT